MERLISPHPSTFIWKPQTAVRGYPQSMAKIWSSGPTEYFKCHHTTLGDILDVFSSRISFELNEHDEFNEVFISSSTTIFILAHQGRCKMAAIFQTTFSNAFSWMKMYKFRLKLHWSLSPISNIRWAPYHAQLYIILYIIPSCAGPNELIEIKIQNCEENAPENYAQTGSHVGQPSCVLIHKTSPIFPAVLSYCCIFPRLDETYGLSVVCKLTLQVLRYIDLRDPVRHFKNCFLIRGNVFEIFDIQRIRF